MTGQQQVQTIYSSSDIAANLNVQESTLRKYCLILEENGYEFLKNERGHRAFFDNDLITLKKFVVFKDEADMSLKQAAKAVVTWKNGFIVTERDTEENRYIARYDDLINEFKEFRESQNAFNQELLHQLQIQQQYIDNSLKERDQKLMMALKETLEAKKQPAITTAEKKKWWKFW